MTPASQRPYVGSTQDNSELSLAIGYNGINRLIGQLGGGVHPNNSGNPPGGSGGTGTGTPAMPANGNGAPPAGRTGGPGGANQLYSCTATH